MSTDKKPAYGQCYIRGLEDHWAPNCPKREEDLHLNSLQNLQRSSILSHQWGHRNLQENERLLK